MNAVEQITSFEVAGETASSTEIPYGETAGSPQFKRTRLEEPQPLDDEQEKTGDTDQSRGNTDDEESRETQFFNSKIHPPVEAAKIRQQVPRERRLHSRFASRNKNAGLLDPAGNPMPVKAKARLVIQGQHCPDTAQGLVRTVAPTVHRTAVSLFLQIVSSMGWCRSLRCADVSGAFLRGKPREVEEPLFFEPPSRGLPGIEKGALVEIVKCVFLDCPILLPWRVERIA